MAGCVGLWHTPVLSFGPQVLDGLELEVELAMELVVELEELPGGDLFFTAALFWKRGEPSRRSTGMGRARGTWSVLCWS